LVAASGEIAVTVEAKSEIKAGTLRTTLWKAIPAEDRAPDAWRPPDGTAWTALAYASDDSPLRFTNLPAGKYRVSALQWDEANGPAGYSAPVQLDSDQARAAAAVALQRGSRLELRVVNETDRKLMPLASVELARATHDWPYSEFARKRQSDGLWVIENLPPGRYRANASQRAGSPDALTYELSGSPVEIEIARAGEVVMKELVVRGRPLAEREKDQWWPWIVEGTVRNADGQPLPDVEISASAGWGTLRHTGSARTDAKGNYRMRFGPGIAFYREHPDQLDVQAAVIHAHLPGHAEANLCRQGDLLAVNRALKPGELED
jgi:hypothetical protein